MLSIFWAIAVATAWAAGDAGPAIVLRHHAASWEGRTRWLAASGDAYHFAYLARVGDEEFWFIDGKKAGSVPRDSVVKPFKGGDDFAVVSMSYDGETLAFVQGVNDDSGRPIGSAVSVNGALDKHAYERITSLELSRTGGNVAYVAFYANAYRVVHNGVEGPTASNNQLSLTFAREGGNLAYVQEFQGKLHLMLNHQRMQLIGSYPPALAFTPGLERFAIAQPVEGGWAATLDGKQIGRIYNLITDIEITEDGKRVGYLGRDGDALPFQAVLDGVEVGPKLDPADKDWPALVFAPTTNAPYWTGRHAGAWKLFVDGKPQGSWDSIFSRPRLAFSPRGKHFAYAATKGASTYLVIDGKLTAVKPFHFFARSGIAFDNEEEFHYLEESPAGATLVCGSVTRQPPTSVCPSTARRLYPKRKKTDPGD